jgi:crossover junction endodeoxyribonuclease RusA
MKAFVVKGRPILTSSNKNLADWRRLVADGAQPHAKMHEGAVHITLSFGLPRPKSLPKKVLQNVKRPDLDKLIRGVCDALTGIMWNDDSQIVMITAAKTYALQPGVHILIEEV